MPHESIFAYAGFPGSLSKLREEKSALSGPRKAEAGRLPRARSDWLYPYRGGCCNNDVKDGRAAGMQEPVHISARHADRHKYLSNNGMRASSQI